VNAILGEDATMIINNAVFVLCPPTSAPTEADDGSDEKEDGDGETLTKGGGSKKKRWE